MQTKNKTTVEWNMSALNLPGVLSEQTSNAYAKTLGADKADAESLVKQVAQIQSRAANMWGGFNQVRANRDPRDTPAAHLGKLEKANEKLQKALFSQIDPTRERLRMREQEIEKEIEARFNQSSNDAAEVRAVLRDMPKVEDRTNAVMQAIDSGDASVLAAVMSGKPVTTGIDAKYVKTLRDYAEKKLTPDLMAKKQQIKKAATVLMDVLDSTIRISDEAIGAPEARAKFLMMANEADKAIMGFTKMFDTE